MNSITAHYRCDNAYERYSRILESMDDNPSGTMLVAPNRRVSDYLLSLNPALTGIKSVESLSYALIRGFYPYLGYDTPPESVTAQQQKLILLEAARNPARGIPNLTAKSSYLQEIYDLVHRIDESGLGDDTIRELAAKLNRQRFYDIIDIIGDYRAILERNHKLDYPKMISLAIRLLSGDKPAGPDISRLIPVSRVIITDLHTLSPLGAQLIESLASLMQIPVTAYSSVTEKFWTFKGADKRIAEQIPFNLGDCDTLHNRDYQVQKNDPVIKQYEFPTYEDEAIYAALKAASLLYEGNVSPASVIIAYRNLRGSSAVLVRDYLAQLGIPSVISSASTNFYTHPLVAHILHLVILADNTDELAPCFRSPLIALCGPVIGMEPRNIHSLTASGVFPASPPELLAALNAKVSPDTPYLSALNKVSELIRANREKGLVGVLQAIYDQYGDKLDNRVYQELLIRAGDFISHNPDISPGREITEFIRFTQDARFTDDVLGLSSSNTNSIRIIPFHEVILAHYPKRVEHLFALGLSEGSLPMEYNQAELAQPRIFLHAGDILNDKYDSVNIAFDALLEEKNLFNILPQNTSNLYLSYSRTTPSGDDAIPSRFLAPGYDEPERLGHLYSLMGDIAIPKEKPKYSLTIKKYSASLISTYVDCPYKAYLDRCNINKSASLASIKGILVHRVISDSITENRPVSVESLSDGWVQNYLDTVPEKDFRYYAQVWIGYNLHDRMITVREMQEICSNWNDYAGRKIIPHTELGLEFDYIYGGEPYRFYARLDGVIDNGDGSYDIFDIKTGSADNHLELQVYSYVTAYNAVKPGNKINRFQVVKNDAVKEYPVEYRDGIPVVLKKGRKKDEWVDISVKAKEEIDESIRGIISNNWEPKPSKQQCGYCDYKPVCPAWLEDQKDTEMDETVG